MGRGFIKIGRDSRGNYKRDAGYEIKASGKVGQHTFYLGSDYAEACIRYSRLDQTWDKTVIRWHRSRDADQPLWDETTLSIAMAVARGEATCGISIPQVGFYVDENCIGPGAPTVGLEQLAKLLDEHGRPARTALAWFQTLQKDFSGIIPLSLANGEEALSTVKAGAKAHRTLAERQEALTVGPQTLHSALQQFADWLKATHLRPEDKTPTPFGEECARQVLRIKDHTNDMPLDAFGLLQMEALEDYWSNRPVMATGRIAAKSYVTEMLKRIRKFFKWLHRSPAFSWKKPYDYEIRPLRISTTPAEKARRLSTASVTTYSQDELTTLWKYATARERLYLLLALNCGFGQTEIGTLQMSDVHFDQAHGFYEGLQGSWIKRLRQKTDSYGEFKLWPETVTALQEYLAARPSKSESLPLILSPEGKSLIQSSGKTDIADDWETLKRRIKNAGVAFRKVSFNKLRKTAANFVRRAGGGEMSAIFLMHGKTVIKDSLAEVYTDRPFDQLHGILDRIHSQVVSIFTGAPVQEKTRYAQKKVSPALRQKIVQMRRDQIPYLRIRTETGLALNTIRSIATDAGMVKSYKPRKAR